MDIYFGTVVKMFYFRYKKNPSNYVIFCGNSNRSVGKAKLSIFKWMITVFQLASSVSG